MSPRRGASSGSYAIGIAVSQIISQRGAIAHRSPAEFLTRSVFPRALQMDGQPPKIQEDALVAKDELPGFNEATVSDYQWRSAGTSAPALGPEWAQRSPRTRVVGYASLDAERVDGSSDELRRQVDEIARECDRRSLRLLEVVRERERKRQRPFERPGLGYALGRIAAGEAGGLVVAELSGLCRSVQELGRVLEWLARRDARFVAAVPRVDTAEEPGRLVVRTIIDVSCWERKRLGDGRATGCAPRDARDRRAWPTIRIFERASRRCARPV